MRFHLDILTQAQQRADALAEAIGLNDFRVGRHVLRDHRNWKTGELEVAAIWAGVIMPSFREHHAIVSCAISSRKEERKPLAPIHRYGIATFDQTSVEPHEVRVLDSEPSQDSLASILACLPWNSGEWHLTLDGTGYVLLSDTMTFAGFLTFANPRDPALLSLVELFDATRARVLNLGASALR